MADSSCSSTDQKNPASNKVIQSVPAEKLFSHPGNANRMSKADFCKLVEHIRRSDNYEPIVVRPHPVRAGGFEIINGHHRFKALRQIGYHDIDCLVWEVNDDETLILLNTLNRLTGSDDVYKKSELIKKLSEKFNTSELVKMLPDSSKQLERLKNLNKPVNSFSGLTNHLLNPLVFFLTDEQKVIVDEVINLAIKQKNGETSAARKAAALVKIATVFRAISTNKKTGVFNDHSVKGRNG